MKTRVIISRITNGATLERGDWTVPKSYGLLGESREPYYQFGAPELFEANQSAEASWPAEAPAAERIGRIVADIARDGGRAVADFFSNERLAFSGTKVIVRVDDLPKLAQALADTSAATSTEAVRS